MAQWNLDQLRHALERKGWRVVAEHPGDDYAVSATWEIQRGHDEKTILIDFEGLEDMTTLPVDHSYGCHVRGNESMSLYFGRQGERGSNRRQIWQSDLRHFIERLGSGSAE
jgi:hypothetical protein